MNWSEQVWNSISDKYQSILDMPFIKELTTGNLPKEKFQFYMAQDSLYLEHFGRALALIGARAYDVQDALSYMRFGENAIVVENALHDSYFKDFGVTEKGHIQPVCHHYVHYLKSTAALDPVEVGMAATLPCFWIYKEVGEYIARQEKTVDNPYQKWIDTYGGEDFAISVRQAIAMCDQVAANTTVAIRNKMSEAFVLASRLEYQFWEAAYNEKVWT